MQRLLVTKASICFMFICILLILTYLFFILLLQKVFQLPRIYTGKYYTFKVSWKFSSFLMWFQWLLLYNLFFCLDKKQFVRAQQNVFWFVIENLSIYFTLNFIFRVEIAKHIFKDMFCFYDVSNFLLIVYLSMNIFIDIFI